jgi:hypothetical protein
MPHLTIRQCDMTQRKAPHKVASREIASRVGLGSDHKSDLGVNPTKHLSTGRA